MTPATFALPALMCLHAARLPARLDASGDLSTLADQDRSRWDRGLLAEGHRLLERSATGAELTEYHVEAAIAAVHACAAGVEDTNWAQIVVALRPLMTLRPSPVVALNRAIAVAQREGSERGLEEIHAIADQDRLDRVSLLSRGARRAGAALRAGGAPRASISAPRSPGARNPMERRFLEQRIERVRRQRSSPHPRRRSARPPITRDQARGQVAHPQPPQPGQNAPFGAELTTAGSRAPLTAVP